MHVVEDHQEPATEPLDVPGMEESPLNTAQRALAGVVGMVGAGTGVGAVFGTDNELGSTALITAGVYFLVAAIQARFPKLKFGDNEIDPTARGLARQALHIGQQAGAEVEEAKEGLKEGLGVSAASASEPPATDDASRVDQVLADLAREYKRVRYTMTSGSERTSVMTGIVDRMRSRVRELGPNIDETDVLALLNAKDIGLQLAGISAAYERPGPVFIPALTQLGVVDTKPFNEFWALQALLKPSDVFCQHFSAADRQLLRDRLKQLPAGIDRARLIRRILDRCP